jgi:phage recombination protein Bet
VSNRELFKRLEHIQNSKQCIRCDSELQIAWMKQADNSMDYGLRCNCVGKPPLLSDKIHYVQKRWSKMAGTALELRTAELPLTPKEVQQFFCAGATDSEAEWFMRYCVILGADPFLHEAYLVKYGSSPAVIQPGIALVLKKADAHPSYQGYQSGVVVLDNEDQPLNRNGSMVLPGEMLVGGWCNIQRKDQPHMIEVTVGIEEYKQWTNKDGAAIPTKMWATKPGVMIEKSAVTMAHRRGFPGAINLLFNAPGIELKVEQATEDTGLDGDVSLTVARERFFSNTSADKTDAPSEASQPASEPPDTYEPAPIPEFTAVGDFLMWAIDESGLNHHDIVEAALELGIIVSTQKDLGPYLNRPELLAFVLDAKAAFASAV